jgi:D-alanyl-D-alanine carboxypeptidase
MAIGAVPADAQCLQRESLTLGEIIRLVNKHSSNVMARTLLLTLAAERTGRPATAMAGGQVCSTGSRSRASNSAARDRERLGLSRNERISAAGLADVLLAANQEPVHAGIRGVAAALRDGRHTEATVSARPSCRAAADEDRDARGRERAWPVM